MSLAFPARTRLTLLAFLVAICGGDSASAAMCGDADGSGTITVTDGVAALKTAVALDDCSLDLCDVDGSGAVTVTDGVNILRAAAGLPTVLACARWIDNLDGTVTDSKTGLQWELKSSALGSGPDPNEPHDVDNLYHWCSDPTDVATCDAFGHPSDGGSLAAFLARLNTPPCFARHCDWRLPTVARDGDAAELESIVDVSAPGCGAGGACIAPALGPAATGIGNWSATSLGDAPFFAWSVSFANGEVGVMLKIGDAPVRAVRRAGD